MRSRGPFPVLRIGRQPYGVLPATALSDWRADRDRDVDALLAPWLRRARRRWREVVEEVPRIRPDQPADQITVDALSRLPVATGLAMRRMNGPDFAVPLTPREDPPSTTGIPGVPPDAALRWTTRSDGWTDLGWGLDPATGTPLFVTRFTEQDPRRSGRRRSPPPTTCATSARSSPARCRPPTSTTTGRWSCPRARRPRRGAAPSSTSRTTRTSCPRSCSSPTGRS